MSRRILVPPASKRLGLVRPVISGLGAFGADDPAAAASCGSGGGVVDINSKPGDPVFLSSYAAVKQGAIAQPPIDTLRAPKGFGLEIHEIRFFVGQPEDLVTVQAEASGAFIEARLNLGAFPVTNGFVPIQLFTRQNTIQVYAETDEFWSGSSYAWVLPQPLYVPPGAVLTPAFQHTGFSFNDNIPVRIGYVGTLVEKKTSSFALPYITTFKIPIHTYADALSGSSVETDLANITKWPVKLQRMVSAFVLRKSTNVGVVTSVLHGFSPIAYSLKITSSDGHDIIPDPTPVPSILDADPWDLSGFSLNPDSYWKVDWSKRVPNGNISNPWQAFLCFALSGHVQFCGGVEL